MARRSDKPHLAARGMTSAPASALVLVLTLVLAGCGRDGAGDVAGAGASAEAAGARVEAGRRLFARCAGCHTVDANASNIFGPQLRDVLGRRAGSVPGYAYSPAMRAAPLVWDEQNLAAFIRDPDRVVPGNRMRFMSFMSERQAADIVAYLAANQAAHRAPSEAGSEAGSETINEATNEATNETTNEAARQAVSGPGQARRQD